MDELQRSYYGMAFARAFARKRGVEFQDWFVEIMGLVYGADFEPVRTYGPKGDFKCDGRLLSLGRIHQCYAPYELTDKETIAKADEDFNGAVKHWRDFMRSWCFVHNDDRGLPATVERHLDGLRKKHSKIEIVVWGEASLREIVLNLPVEKLTLLFGPAPTTVMLDRVGFEDLKPIIDALAQAEPDPIDVPLVPPSAHKLEKNRLSSDSEAFLRIGRRKEPLVADFIQRMVWPGTPEKIAEAMRARYAALKAGGLAPDIIFGHLLDFVGMSGDAKRRAAALAVMSYFFESCDVFEDVDAEAHA